MIRADLPQGPCISPDRISMVYLNTTLRRLTTYEPRADCQSMAYIKLPAWRVLEYTFELRLMDIGSVFAKAAKPCSIRLQSKR